MLKIEALKVGFNGRDILQEVDLEIADEECLAIIGESGAGKTTLGLSIMGLSESKSLFYPHQLSGGEQQRVLIAIALANDSKTLILDEPVSSLDADSRRAVMRFLRKAVSGRTVLLTTHDFATAAQMATRVATLYGGRIVELGPAADRLSNPCHPYTRILIFMLAVGLILPGEGVCSSDRDGDTAQKHLTLEEIVVTSC